MNFYNKKSQRKLIIAISIVIVLAMVLALLAPMLK